MDKAERGAHQTIKHLQLFDGVDTIMDIGANVGHVSRWLKDYMANRVVSYEPHPKAFQHLKKRCRDCELINAALLTNAGESIISTSNADDDANYFCNASMVSVALPVHHNITVLSFADELKRVKPDAIKMDVEGSEYDMLLNNVLPESVKWISMEVHKLNTIGGYLFAAMVCKLAAQGFGMLPLQPGVRAVSGAIKSYWGFMQVDFVRGVASAPADIKWVNTLVKVAKRKRVITRSKELQQLFDKEFPNAK